MLTTDQELNPPTLGQHGQPCAECRAPLAHDQRYCMNCGARRSNPRVPISLAAGSPRPARESTTDRTTSFMSLWSTPLRAGTALVGLVLLLLALLVGVVIGNSGDQPRPVAAAAPKPQVITVAPPSTGPAASSANTTFTSDWPDGKQGFTIQLKALP